MVSVIIPTYNREKLLVRSINSVLKQTYTDLEVIVVDDCSFDNTQIVVKKIKDSRVRYYKMRENIGACGARNFGIGVALGEYIAFQDSDDVWKEGKIEMQLYKMKKNDANISFSAFNRIHYNKKQKKFPIMSEGYKDYKEVLCGFFVSTQTILAKKTIFDENNFDETIGRMQDYDLIIRIAKKERIYFVEDVLVDVFLQDDSITDRKNFYKKDLEISRILLHKYAHEASVYPDFKIIMLKKIAQAQTMEGIDSRETYIEIWELSNKRKDAIKIVLYQLGCMKIGFKIWNKLFDFR